MIAAELSLPLSRRNNMERRWGNRVMLDETVTVMRDGERIGTARLHELSLSGAFLQTEWHLPQLARVHVEIPPVHGEHRTQHSHVEAFVARNCTDGIGLEWCEFAPASVAALMEERRHDSAPLVRDPAFGSESSSPRRRLR